MYVNRRMEKPLGWYPGPFVISLASIASDVGVMSIGSSGSCLNNLALTVTSG